MRTAGIIAEYNPLHNGHKAHIAATRAAGAENIIVVLGSHFTQRGEPALLSKHDRVRMALAAGADLVIELPQLWTCSSAESFAYGGISLLNAIGCVDTISFGSECGNTDILKTIADCMCNNPQFHMILQQKLKSGISYAAAVQSAIENILGTEIAAHMKEPNNILGIEYCKALYRLHSHIQPFTIQRMGAGYHQAATDGNITSATHLRQNLYKNDWQSLERFMPTKAANILCEAHKNQRTCDDLAWFWRVQLAKLRSMTADDLKSVDGVGEGLENRIITAARQCNSIPQLLDQIATKRYPRTRLQRILTAALLDIQTHPTEMTPPYIRVLGIGAHGADLLHQMKTTATLPLFTDATQPPKDVFSQYVFNIECKASDVYSSILPVPSPCGSEFTQKMLRLPARK